jgi:acetylornithine/N-succinyldiaminopimelate aminotransferase
MTVNDAELQQRFARDMMGSAPAPAAFLARGEGCYVWDVDGKRYLDFLAGIAVNSLGHAHPVLVKAVSEQVATLAHISNLFSSQPALALAERLKRITGAGDEGRVFFCNSGAEAIEAAIKLARRNKQHGVIIALENSFHGRTMGSVSLTGKEALRKDFEPLLPNVLHIDSTIAALEAALADHDVAALVVEPIKGEAGVIPLPDGYLEAARELTARHGALLIIDEIQTGAGRTGTWFAFQRSGIVPDAVAVAKGVGGGVPIGAIVTFGAASALLTRGQHGTTYGGNPLMTAAANAVLTEIEDAGLIENARVRGEQLKVALAGKPLVAEVRGEGLLLGVGLTAPVGNAIVTTALELGLIINAANDTSIRIAPPLIIGDAELAEFIDLFTQALEANA